MMEAKNMTIEEVIAAAKEHGIELTEDDLLNVTGGEGSDGRKFEVGDRVVAGIDHKEFPTQIRGTIVYIFAGAEYNTYVVKGDMKDEHGNDRYYYVRAEYMGKIK